MNKNLIVLLLALIVSFTAQAQLKCPEWADTFRKIYADESGLLEADYYEEDASSTISCRDVAKIGNVVNEVHSLLGSKIRKPDKLILNVMNDYENAYVAGPLINVPTTLLVQGLTKHPRYTKTVWVHEYGHAILDENLKTKVRGWKTLHLYLEKYIHASIKSARAEDKIIKLQDIMDELENQGHAKEALKIKNKLDKVVKESDFLDERVYKLEAELLKREKLNIMAMPYHELFADVLAVVYDKDGAAVSKALSRTKFMNHHHQEYRTSVRHRDFTDRNNRIDRFKGSVHDIHGYFAPVRYHLWTNYLRRPSYLRESSKTLKKVLDAIVSEINYLLQFSDRYEDFFEFDIKKINERLIKEIDKQFSQK
ncbi:MAG: hypothetical protein N4A33_12345 [Bacteriovoracaceae bacterium]|jgi:hypothetical protein|nr:hypothetical protein [Bacteriovoracaceae bacterium]